MAKLTDVLIGVGTTANDRQGDSLRTAFQKVNVGFTDLYTKLGLVDGSGLNLGAFEFAGSTLSTTDSTAIVIDQAVTVSSNLSVGGDILPSVSNGGDLGSAAKPWKSLYVSGSTIYLGNAALSVDANGELLINDNRILQDNGNYISLNLNVNDVQVSDLQVGDTLQWAGGFWVNGPDGGGVTSYNNLTDKPTLFSGSYNDLTNKPDLAGTYQFSVAADDSTQRLVSTDEVIKFIGTNGITTASDAEGNITISKTSELVSVTVPTIGGTASAGEAGITYLSGDLSKWAIFTEGAFTVGVWDDVEAGWTVTDNNGFTDTIAGRGSFGAASFSTTVNNWPSPASGKTYVFTSPDYQAGYTNPVEITVGDNDWTFDLNGVLTLPIGATNNGRISNINGISLAVDTSFWTFDPSGALTIPGDIRSESAINIDINLSDSTLRRWRFSEGGDLTLPAGGDIKNSNGNSVLGSLVNGTETFTLSATGNATFSGETGGVNRGIVWDYGAVAGGVNSRIRQDEDGLTVRAYTENSGSYAAPVRILTNQGDNERVWQFDGAGDLTIPGDIKSENAINIDINLSDSTLRRWRFGEDGDLTVPGSIKNGNSKLEFNTGGDTNLTLTVGDTSWQIDSIGFLNAPNQRFIRFYDAQGAENGIIGGDNLNHVVFAAGANKGIKVFTDGATNLWTFGTDGSLTLPGDIRSEGNINIDINLSDSTLRRWTFGEDGNLTFPDGTNQSTAFTGNAATIDITDTNGIDTNYYLTFVENRDGGEILRADIDLIFNSADNTLTAGNITTGVLKIDDGVHEKFQTKADATGVVTHDCALGHIIYHTSPDDYFTVNLTNLNLASGYATSITVVMVQGATGYGPNALQIGGVAQTINWQGGSLPAAPTANGVDVMTFSILNNSGTYTVLGQVTGFNEVA